MLKIVDIVNYGILVMKIKDFFTKIVLFSFILVSVAAYAQPPYGPDMINTSANMKNEWEVTYYLDHKSHISSGSSHQQWATQKLCFYYAGTVDSHQRYYVVSSSYPGWSGSATQEGDLVRIKMTFWNGKGNDEIAFNLSTIGPKDRGMGHWDETVETWSIFGTTFWGNTELKRTGACKVASEGKYTSNELKLARYAKEEYSSYYLRKKGGEERTPMGKTNKEK